MTSDDFLGIPKTSQNFLGPPTEMHGGFASVYMRYNILIISCFHCSFKATYNIIKKNTHCKVRTNFRIRAKSFLVFRGSISSLAVRDVLNG